METFRFYKRVACATDKLNTTAVSLAAFVIVATALSTSSATAQTPGASGTNAPTKTAMEVTAPAGSNYAVASFRFWFPDEKKPMRIRGVVTLTPGSNGDGRNLVEDAVWQEFARRHDFALAGCFFKDRQHENMNIEEYALASAGSGQALLDAIGKFAADNNHPEAAQAPLLLWGHSAGGEFNYEFACWKPERVAAFVVNKGGYYYTHLAPAAARKVPGILFIGQKDEEFRKESVRGIFAVNRRAGALWTFAAEPNAAHEPGGTRVLAMKFFDAIIPLRLPADNTGETGLAALPTGPGLVGNLNTFEIQAEGPTKQPAGLTSWLPNQALAVSWREFVMGETGK